MFNGRFRRISAVPLRERAARERSGAVGVAQRSERAAFPPLPLPRLHQAPLSLARGSRSASQLLRLVLLASASCS